MKHRREHFIFGALPPPSATQRSAWANPPNGVPSNANAMIQAICFEHLSQKTDMGRAGGARRTHSVKLIGG
jgi:hypothetical protein